MATRDWRQRLLGTVGNNPDCVRLMRNWDWYLGHEVTPSDFQLEEVQRYVNSLQDEISARRWFEMKAIIEALWRNGFDEGLIPNEPREI